ncbi:hypothetical protein D3C87_302050 [compost metagenome]
MPRWARYPRVGWIYGAWDHRGRAGRRIHAWRGSTVRVITGAARALYPRMAWIYGACDHRCRAGAVSTRGVDLRCLRPSGPRGCGIHAWRGSTMGAVCARITRAMRRRAQIHAMRGCSSFRPHGHRCRAGRGIHAWRGSTGRVITGAAPGAVSTRGVDLRWARYVHGSRARCGEGRRSTPCVDALRSAPMTTDAALNAVSTHGVDLRGV